MDSSPATTDLEGRKKVRLRLRRALTVTEQECGGRPGWVVKDPVTLHYHRLDERQRFLVQRMDGASTLEEVREAYEDQFRPERLSLEELEGFAAQLVAGGLVESESPQAGKSLFERG